MAGLTGQRLERYEILEQIGRGGMAAVYRAYDRAEDRFVAIKVVAPHLSDDPNFEQRFRLEAKVLMDLRHPSIIPVEDYGETDGYTYLVMPFLKVGTLTDRLLEGPVSPHYGATLVQQISDALQYSHDQGVVHRDVKPSNILLDEQGNAHLSDFGLARLQESHASLTGAMMVGTPAFISPEQARGDKANAFSDQYSLGVILYLLTTGELPFDAETPIAVAIKHISEPLPTIQNISPNVPEVVERVILRATAKDPADRFESVAELNLAFQAAIAHVLDPQSNPVPGVRLPGSVRPTQALPVASEAVHKTKLRLAAAGIGVLLAVMLASPVLAAFGRPTEVGEGAPALLATAAATNDHLTELEATMAAMSTELAGSRAELMRAEQVQTAVVLTLQAAEVYPSATPSPAASESPTEDTGITFLTPQALILPTETKTPLPTATSPAAEIPTATPSTTASPIPPTPTDSPSATPVDESCSGLSIGSLPPSGSVVSWQLTNGGLSGLTLTSLVLDWPDTNGSLKKVRLEGSMIWNQGDNEPSTDIQEDWKGNRNLRNLPSGATKTLHFEFAAASTTGYSLSLEFDNGCQATD
jgi:serine/threonine-protein kinase